MNLRLNIMSFSLYTLPTTTHDSNKHDRLSNLLLTPTQNVSANLECSDFDEDCDFNLDATFDNDGAVTNIKMILD